MRHETLIEAIHDRRCIRFRYDGEDRFAEPHAYGEGKHGALLRGYQTAGGSSSGKTTGGKLFRVSDIAALESLPETFGVRTGYRRGDSAMQTFHAQVDD